MVKELDVQALKQEYAQLQQEFDQTKERLDSLRGPPRGGLRGGLARGGVRAPYGRSDSFTDDRGDPDRRGMGWSGRVQPPGQRAMGGPGPVGRGGGVFARLAGGALGRPNPRDAAGPRDPDFDQGLRDRGMGMGGPMGGMGPPRRRGPIHDHDDRDGQQHRFDPDLPPPSNGWQPPVVEPASRPKRRLLSSAVVIEEQPEINKQDEDEQAGVEGEGEEGAAGLSRKRSAEPSAAPEEGGMRKRNRRMFANLLVGTLKTFQKENEQFASSDVARQRSEALRKAEERERTESDRLRRKEHEARQAAKGEELDKLSAVSLAADIKQVELLYATRISRRANVAKSYLLTKSHPPLYWAPANPSKHTDKLLEAQQKELETWKEGLLVELDQERDGLTARSNARREAALARRAAAAARAAKGQTAGQAPTKEEEEEERTLAAGEYATVQRGSDAGGDQGDGAADTQGDQQAGEGDKEEGEHAGTAGSPGQGAAEAQPGGAAGEAEEEGEAGRDEEGEGDDDDDEEMAPVEDKDADTIEDLLA